jgi:hypothetical protein
MTYTSTQILTFDEFIIQYGDNPRYELIDGELRDMEPTGPHEAVTGQIIGYIMFVCVGFHSSTQPTNLFELISNLNLTG